jgi:hypothetical protein
MSIASIKRPTVFEADLPTVSSEDAPTPEAAHEALKQAPHAQPASRRPRAVEAASGDQRPLGSARGIRRGLTQR